MTELAALEKRVAELKEEKQKEDRESFTKLATDLFSQLAGVKDIFVCDPNTLYRNLHAAEQFARNRGDCDVVRVTLENGMTIALAGEPQGDVARFDVWTDAYSSGHPQFVLSNCRDAEASFIGWKEFQTAMGVVPYIDKMMKIIADKLLEHPYVGRCSVGTTGYIKRPIERTTVTYDWS